MLGIKKSVFFPSAAFLALFFVLSPKLPAFAASSGTVLTTSPISVDLTAKPGATTTTNLQVQNNGTKAVNIIIRLEEFKAQGNSGQAQIFAPPSNDPSLSWVHFSQTSFSAQQNVWVPVTMSITLPKTAAFGYYYAVLFSPSVSVSSATGLNATFKGSNAILVLVDAHTSGQTNTLKVENFTSDRSSYQYLPANFKVDIRNTGNVFTVPEGDIYISRTPNGPVIDTLDLNSAQGNVLPGTDRIFEASWSNGFPFYQVKRINGQIVSNKKGVPVKNLDWNFTKITNFRFGKYYARLVLVYNNGAVDIPINAQLSFWVIPWTLLGIFIVIFLLVGAGFWTVGKSVFKKAQNFKNKK